MHWKNEFFLQNVRNSPKAQDYKSTFNINISNEWSILKVKITHKKYSIVHAFSSFWQWKFWHTHLLNLPLIQHHFDTKFFNSICCLVIIARLRCPSSLIHHYSILKCLCGQLPRITLSNNPFPTPSSPRWQMDLQKKLVSFFFLFLNNCGVCARASLHAPRLTCYCPVAPVSDTVSTKAWENGKKLRIAIASRWEFYQRTSKPGLEREIKRKLEWVKNKKEKKN